MRNTRILAASMAGLALAGILAACAPAASEVAEEEPIAQEQEDETDAEPVDAADGPATLAEWALPYTTDGEKIATLESDGFRVDVYQVGTVAATKTGSFATPDGKPVIAVGDEIVFLNYVVTNTGDEAINLSNLLVEVDARYDDWPYLQGMDSVVDSALYEEMGVNYSAYDWKAEEPYVFEPGATFAYGTNFRYEKGSAISFTARVVPVLPNGDLDHDNQPEAKGSGVTP